MKALGLRIPRRRRTFAISLGLFDRSFQRRREYLLRQTKVDRGCEHPAVAYRREKITDLIAIAGERIARAGTLDFRHDVAVGQRSDRDDDRIAGVDRLALAFDVGPDLVAFDGFDGGVDQHPCAAFFEAVEYVVAVVARHFLRDDRQAFNHGRLDA